MNDDDLARLLAHASQEGLEPELTAEQREANNDVMSRLRRESAAALQRSIESRELLSLKAFQTALSVDVEHIRDTVKSGGMFAISGPAAEEFYPAFYADESANRGHLEMVAKALIGVSAASKFHFFTSKSTLLGTTPLKALAFGRLDQVLTAAAAFSER